MNPLYKMTVTSPFGWRIHPILKTRRYHTGVDLRARVSKKLFAINDGEVSEINKNTTNAYGKYIVISHANGYLSFYAHLSQIYVKVGEKVEQSQVIGLTGNTGKYSTAPHLHFGITKGSIKGTSDWINPLDYLNKLKEEEDLEATTITLIKKDGKIKELAGQIFQGTTLAPVRALGEALGCQVDYDAETKLVKITEGGL